MRPALLSVGETASHSMSRLLNFVQDMNKMNFISALILCVIYAFTIRCAHGASNRVASSPNIIFILADDLGWDDVGFHGSEIKTPNIDRLAKEGVILNNYYVQPVCTPTRSAILSGRYPIHTGLQHDVIHGAQAFGMPLNLTILPQHLKKFGYKTHAIGKWHLGFISDAYIPESRGFDSFLGYYNGHEDYFDHHIHFGNFSGLDFHYRMQPLWNYSEMYSTDIFANHARSIIESHNKSNPLFMYFAHQAVHAADYDVIQAPQKYIDRFPYITNMRRKYFAGAVAGIDDSVGLVYQSLVDAGMADNTVIVFSTDNGGPTHGMENNAACNWPLRGCKNTLWQGGVHGVGFVHSPLLQTSGYVNDNLIHVTDWLPTLLSLAAMYSSETNADISETLNDLDGVNQWDVLSLNKSSDRNEVLINIDPTIHNEAIVVGNFKLIYGESALGYYDGWYPPPPHEKPKINSLQSDGCSGLSCQNTNDNTVNEKSKKNTGNNRDVLRVIEWMNKRYEEFRGNVLSISKNSRISSLQFFSSKNTEPKHEISHVKSDAEGKGIIRIDCGPKPANASTNCDLKKAPCLFNLKDDPCEYMNLAYSLPDVVKKLIERLDEYRKTMVPPANKPVDPRADPALHGGVWQPWL